MVEKLQNIIAQAVESSYGVKITPNVSLPESEFGDFSTNVAFQVAGQLKKAPKAIADELVQAIKAPQIAEVMVAGSGFINFRLTDNALWQRLDEPIHQSLVGQTVVAEYSDPNPFKVLHAGHLYTSVVGDAIANLMEVAGAKVSRVNFGGDVGRHAARAMWGIIQKLGGEFPDKLGSVLEDKRADWMAEAYVVGSTADEEDLEAKTMIDQLNQQIYKIASSNDRESDLARIYWVCRQWSYDYFEEFYARIGSKFDKYYPESITTPFGLELVEKGLDKGVLERSEGAVVFRGEQYGLHTRVFLTSKGVPTYEAKDAGLNICKWNDYHFDKSVVITGNDILEYMKVVLKVVEQLCPDIPLSTKHITHGQVKLQGGVKMSSRKGNILRATDVMDAASEAAKTVTVQASDQMVLAAVKYAFLKSRIGGDVVYDPAESVNILGNSGPYLQYAHARARSILTKGGPLTGQSAESLEPGERVLLAKLGEYQMVVEGAVEELMPHGVCGYLYELAQVFNAFYEKNRVMGDPREKVRLNLVQAYAGILKNGLELLGITAPDRV